jgi:transposase
MNSTMLLNLKGFHVLSQVEHEGHLEITVENRFKPQSCPNCDYSHLYSHDKTEQIFFDTPIQGKSVVLKTQRIRYKCRSCGKTFREPLADIDDKRLMTSRLKEHIQKRAMRETFAVVARETGLDEKTIRHVFDDYAYDKAQSMPFVTPRILGIEELKLVGSFRCILTNIEYNTVFDMLPSRKEESVREYLKTLPDKHNIEQVIMDMWRPYKDAVNVELPGRIIVIDKFHIVRMANDSLEASRKAIRASLERKDRLKLKNERFVLLKRRNSLSDEETEKLQKWSAWYPELGLAYDAKEAFFCIFDQGLDSKTAKEALIAWQRGIDPSISRHFEPLTKALNNWMSEILNGFDYPITNAYTESINRLAKDLQRMGRGYSFDVVRAKMLYDTKANKPTTSTIRKKKRVAKKEPSTMNKWSLSGSISEMNGSRIIIEKEVKYYGPHIPTLSELLE